MTKDLEALRLLAQAATPGPWRAKEACLNVMEVQAFGEEICQLLTDPSLDEETRADAAYIAAANPSTILALLAQLEQAERERDELKKTLALPDTDLSKLSAREAVRSEVIIAGYEAAAALRTLRQASADFLHMDRLWSKNVDEFGGIKQADEEFDKRKNALAAALAAEGGK